MSSSTLRPRSSSSSNPAPQTDELLQVLEGPGVTPDEEAVAPQEEDEPTLAVVTLAEPFDSSTEMSNTPK